MPEKLRARWKGATGPNGQPLAYLSGVPARSLTEADWQRLSPEQRERVRASDLYDVRTDAEMAEPSPRMAPGGTAGPGGTEKPKAEGKEG